MKGLLFGVMWLMLAIPAVAQTVNKATLAEQKMCSEAAHTYFKNLLDNDQHIRTPIRTYTNHFNVKLGKCFIEVHELPRDDESLSVTVTDLFENIKYGEWHGRDFVHNGQFQQASVWCLIYDAKTRATASCASREAFDAAMRPLMTE